MKTTLNESLSLKLLNDPKHDQTVRASSENSKAATSLLSSPCNGSSVVFRISPSDWALELLVLSPIAEDREEKTNGWIVAYSTNLDTPAIHLAASTDARLVAVACSDGSVRCFDVTCTNEADPATAALTPRWTASFTNDASTALQAVQSFAFAPPMNHEYWLLLVDSEEERLIIYNALSGAEVPSAGAAIGVSSASWYPNISSSHQLPLAIGRSDGSLTIAHFDGVNLNIIHTLQADPLFNVEDDNNCTIPWRCSHLKWLQTATTPEDSQIIAVGFIRILEVEDDQEDDNDDDPREHQVNFFVLKLQLSVNDKEKEVDHAAPFAQWIELGYVTPFFGVPRGVQHVFFTSYVSTPYTESCHGLLFVGCNLSSDVSVIAQTQLQGSQWDILDLQEGSYATTPTDEYDEFTFPRGLVICTSPLARIATENKGTQVLLLASTDGSVSEFTIDISTDKQDSQPYADKASSIILIPPLHNNTLLNQPKKEASPTMSVHEPELEALADDDGSSSSPLFAERIVEEAEDCASANAALNAFEQVDVERKGFLPQDSFEILLDILGEGFYGDELQHQLEQVVSETNQFIMKDKFISWYKRFVDGVSSSTDAISMPSSNEDEERAEELAKATKAFDQVSGSAESNSITTNRFKDLMEALGTVYCEDEHKRTIKKISVDGKISRSKFIAWYLDWLFAESNVSDEETDKDEITCERTDSIGDKNWGNLFAVAHGSWKCSACMLLNMPDAVRCPACETLRPAAIETTPSSTDSALPTAAPSTAAGFIGSTGFIFGPSGGVSSSSPDSRLENKPLQDTITTSVSDKRKSIDDRLTSSSSSGDLALPPSDKEKTKATIKCTDDYEKSVAQHRNTAEELASTIFDNLDTEKSGKLNSVHFESLIELLGEGFHGDELQEQLCKVDADNLGVIAKDKFVEWYKKLVEGETSNSDKNSVDSFEEAERAEELDKAVKAFDRLSGLQTDVLPKSKFKDLLESMGTVYCDEEHRHTVKKISVDGMISRDNFTAWYVDWIFGEGGSSDEEIDEDEDGGSEKDDEKNKQGWGNLFVVSDGSWKCSTCMVSNPPGAGSCLACETSKPGVKEVEDHSKTAPVKPPSATGIGTTGFVFSSGFSFVDKNSAESGLSLTTPTTTARPAGFVFDSKFSSSGAGKVTGGITFAPAASDGTVGPTGFLFGSSFSRSSDNTAVNARIPSFQPVPSAFQTSQSVSFMPMVPKATTAINVTKANQSEVSSPMASSTPNLFSGSKDSMTKAPSLTTDIKARKSAAFPPMASNAPKLFSESNDSVNIATASTTEIKAVQSAAFPPMASKAPSLFSGSKDSIKKAPTPTTDIKAMKSAAFPPMASNTPTLFSESKDSSNNAPTPTIDIKAMQSAAFPPMASKAPTLFSGSKDSIKQAPTPTTDIKAMKSAAFPPMASKAPTLFSGSKDSSNNAPTPTTDFKAMQSAAFPPMASKAPALFSGSKDSINKAPTPTTDIKAMKSAAFPPMASKAPALFSGSKDSIDKAPTLTTDIKAMQSAAFPPMASKAPALFSGSKDSSNKAPTPTTDIKAMKSAAFPPMVSNAPALFSGSKDSINKAPTLTTDIKAMQSAAFPPMASKAPSLFSGSKDSINKVPTPTVDIKAMKSAAFPPMASNTPTLFSGSKDSSNNAPTPTIDIKAMQSAAFSHGASKTYTPFSGSNKRASAMNSQPDNEASSGYRYKSEYEALIWTLVTKFTSSLIFLEELKEKIKRSLTSMDRHSQIASILKSLNQVEQTSLTCGNALLLLKERSAFLLSRKDVLERQLAVSTRLIQEVKPGSALLSFVKQQPLDSESESRRRSFVAMALQIQSVIVNLTERVDLMQSLHVTTDSAQLETKRAKRLLLFLKSIYDRTTNLTADIDRLQKHFQEITPRVDSDVFSRASKLESPARRRHRKALTPEQSGVKPALQFEDVSRIVDNLRSSIKAVSAPSVFSRRSRFVREGRNANSFRLHEDKTERRHVVSNLMSSPHESTNNHSRYSALPSSAFFSIENSSKPSQVAMSTFDPSSLSLSLPRSFTERLSSDVAETALAALGKTPAVVKEVHEKNKNVNTRNEKMPGTEGKKKSSAQTRFSVSAAEPSASVTQEKPTCNSNPLTNTLASPGFLSGFGEALPSLTSNELLGKEKDTRTEEKRLSPEKIAEAQFDNTPSARVLSQEVSEVKSSASDFSTVHPSPVLSSVGSEPNYREMLTKFYEEYNISKIGDVESNLAKYKGRESEMFAKLSAKYNAPNPLNLPSALTTSTADSLLFPAQAKPQQLNAFNTFTSASTVNELAPAQSRPSPSPFVTAGSTPTVSFGSPPAFGSDTQSNFGFSFASGQNGSQNTSQSQGFATTFGNDNSSMSSGYQTFPSAGVTFGGKTPKEILIQFYQQHNPSKIGEVDKLLAKYAGNEENLLRNLARKYNMDERLFGLSTNNMPSAFSSPQGQVSFGGTSLPTAGAFGSGFGAGSSQLGGGPALSSLTTVQSNGFGGSLGQPVGSTSQTGAGGVFGQPSALGVSSPSFGKAFGSSGFGAAPTASFGALAGASPPSQFGGGGFGGNFSFPQATPFGSARR